MSPIRQTSFGHTDVAFDRRLHAPGTKGARGACTGSHCEAAPVVSRHWENDAYQDGWWGAYCQRHTLNFGLRERDSR